jgi:hypothetical protein
MVVILALIFCGLAYAQEGIRQVDFKNFTYPLSGPLLGHSDLRWLGDPKDGYSQLKPIHLVKGEELTKDSSYGDYAVLQGFTLQSVQFTELTGNGKEDAIVVLLYQTGGTQSTHYVYIYSFDSGKPKLLAYCYTGDRAYSGLYKVYGGHATLVFELLDFRKNQGDCCSSQFIRTRYRWDGSRFVRFGVPEYGRAK